MMDFDNPARTKYCPCINCGKELDSHTNDGGGSPRPGDISICIKCGMIMQYAKDLSFEKIIPEVLEKIKGDKEQWDKIVRFQKIINENK